MRLFAGTEFDVPPRCEHCGELEEVCQCPVAVAPKLPASEQTAFVFSEKRKRGKVVTIVRGLQRDECDLPELVTTLKNHCGAGGTLKNDDIEIQGEQAERVKQKLKSLGFKLAKR